MATGRFPRVPAIAVFSAARLGAGGRYVNAGDELLTRRLVGWLVDSVPDIEVSRTLGGAAGLVDADGAPPDAVTVFDPRDLQAAARAIRRADLVLLGGGTLLQIDAADSFIPRGMARYVTTVSWLCRVLRTPYLLVGVGVELPPRGWNRRRLVAVARHASRCLVREAQAARDLADAGVEAQVVGDVYLAPAAHPTPVGAPVHATADRAARYGVISPRYDLRPQELAELVALVAALPHVDHWYLLVMHRSPGADDHDAAVTLAAWLTAGSWTIVDGTDRPEAVPPLVAHAEVCMAMRLHAAYIALDEGTPLRLVGDRDKVQRLARALAGADPAHDADAPRDTWAQAERSLVDQALRTEVVAALAVAGAVP